MITQDGPWHCRVEGSFLKRARIALFGLTAAERAENAQTLARMRARVIREELQEDEEILREQFGPEV